MKKIREWVQKVFSSEADFRTRLFRMILIFGEAACVISTINNIFLWYITFFPTTISIYYQIFNFNFITLNRINS